MPLAKAKRIDLGVLDGPDATVWTSEQQLSMMVRNLVDNAIRYSPPGGRVDLSVETNPQHVTIRVADTGPGVPPEERARIFEPFYRILGTEQLGSGLGLAIVGTIARRLGAVIRLDATDSDTGSGLTVSITLPARVQRPA
jgi:two-component system OmpR family sensor kinase